MARPGTAEYQRQWRAKNRERYNRYARERAKKRRYVRRYRRYGITQEWWAKHSLNGCEICGADSLLGVDHCHDTLKARGVLCRKCNAILGFANDNKAILLSAIEYLEEQ